MPYINGVMVPYERVVPVSGRIYVNDVIECNDVLYESVDALVLDIHKNPDEYGIMESREIAGIYFLTDPRYRGIEIVVFTVCDERPDDDDLPEDYPPCGAYDPEGKWWCGWHDDLSSLTWKSKSIVTVG